jgi:DNA polymerase-4
MILCLRIPSLSLVAAWQQRPALRGHPLVLGGLAHERHPMVAASDEARAAGVEEGMPLRQAQRRCPQAVFQPVDAAQVARLERELLFTLYGFTPVIQPPDAHGYAFLQLDGLRLQWPDQGRLLTLLAEHVEQVLGILPALGVGANLFVSRVAAEQAAPAAPIVVPATAGASFLAPLSISYLPMDQDLHAYLELLELKTMGALRSLSRAAWQRQFGAQALTLYDLAGGTDPRPLQPWRPPARLEESEPLDPPLENMEALQFVLRGLADRLGASLLAHGLGARRLLIRLDQETGVSLRIPARFAYPVTAPADLFAGARARLLRARPQAPLERVALAARRLEPACVRQPGLLIRRDGQQESLAEAVLRLQEEYRPELILRAERGEAASPLSTRRVTLRAAHEPA